VRRYIPW